MAIAASEVIEDSYQAGEGTTDPLADGGGGEGQVESSTEGGEDSQGEVEGTPEGGQPLSAGGIPGTPFKDQAALVKGYKDIQRLVAGKDSEIANIKKQLEVALNVIRTKFGAKREGEEGAPEIPKGEAFWKAFSENPTGLIAQLLQAQLGPLLQKLEPRLSTLEGKSTQFENTARVNEFLASHPEFTDELEDQVVEVMEAKPYLKGMPDGIELAYSMVIAANSRKEQGKKAAGEAVAGAKSVAGLGGKKTSLPAAKPKGDPFDDVLDLDKGERELYKLGKK